MHLADAFIQSDLQYIQVIHVLYVCFLGIEPTTFCAANAMLYHWATGTYICLYIIYLNIYTIMCTIIHEQGIYIYIPMIKAEFSVSLLHSSVSHPSEIILICWFDAQETFLIIIINVENSSVA